MKMIAAFLTALALMSACSTSGPSPAEGSSLACDHFRNVMGDVSKGVLSDTELRTKLKQVYDDSDIATPAVQSAAQAMLSADTSGDQQGLLSAAGEMDKACSAAGH
jgi:hypothetical protein